MPELPDLEVFSGNLTKKLHGKTIAAVQIAAGKKLNASNAEFKNQLEGKTVKTVKREGKELHVQFDDGTVLGLHLMLNGKLFVYNGKAEYKNTIIALHFDDGTGFPLTDFQGIATPTLNPESKGAPDALDVTESYLHEQLAGTRAAIKSVLLDQKVIRGIGNAYSDEILWQAGIAPLSASNKIPPGKVKQLAGAIEKVLKNAVKQITASHPDIISGEVRDFLVIHNPAKAHSPTGAAIKHYINASRKTYYTDEQELYK